MANKEIYLLTKLGKHTALPHLSEVVIGRQHINPPNQKISRNHLSFTADLTLQEVSVKNIGRLSVKAFKSNQTMALRSGEKCLFKPGDYLKLPGNEILKLTCETSGENINDMSHRFLQRFGKFDSDGETHGHWTEYSVGGVLVCTSPGYQVTSKLAAFDMDGTLITTKSGRVFPVDENDWKLFAPSVPSKLNQLCADGYSIAIFTNQLGIGLGSTNKKTFKKKVESVMASLGVPVQVCVSTRKDFFRKPQPGMLFCYLKLNDIHLDVAESFFVGDAAGRPAGWTKGKKKDFSAADCQFACNTGLRFVTPDELFLGINVVGVTPGWKPSLDFTNTDFSQKITPADQVEVVVLVGSPAAGKSRIASYLAKHGYTVLCRDELGTWEKCVSALNVSLSKNTSAVIDCTNPDLASRSRYTSVATSKGVPVRCVVMDVPVKHCFHNNAFRRLTDDNHSIVPDNIINSYWKNFVQPTLKEGFKEIIKVPFIPDFDDPDHEMLVLMAVAARPAIVCALLQGMPHTRNFSTLSALFKNSLFEAFVVAACMRSLDELLWPSVPASAHCRGGLVIHQM